MRNEAAITEWMQAQAALLLGVPADSIDPEQPLSRYGLDSLAAATLSGDLEDWLGEPVSPTIAWDYPTIAAIARFLTRTPLPEPPRVAPARPVPVEERAGLGFSLFYFSCLEDGAPDPYRLVVEGARFADRHGFTAIWTPERHFHPFGGIFPNPSVLGAALATVSSRLRIRAGSVVLPLHHPVRVVEEWSAVDQLSGGRVDLAFASGWNPADFLFAPERYADRRRELFEGIATVRGLWRGDPYTGPGGAGPVEVYPHPRPVQPELPVWVTCAQDPETFAGAARIGANVLTGLFFHSLEELSEKISLYRRMRAELGLPRGTVTLMLHTFVGSDSARVLETVREPFMSYLAESVDLWSQAGPDLDTLDARGREDLLRYAFERYVRTAALFGTPQSCLDLVERVIDAGVDEIACLVDFGVRTELVLEALPHLARLVDLATHRAAVSAFYDGLSRMRPLPRSAWLTFGLFPDVIPGFSWVRTLCLPEEGHVEAAVAAQARLRERIFPRVPLESARRLLDFGCGYGTDALDLAARWPRLHVDGCTLSPRQVEIAKNRAIERGLGDRVHFHRLDSSTAELPSRYDVAIGFEVAVYVEDKDQLLRNLLRHLEPDATLVLADFVASGPHTLTVEQVSSFMATRAEWLRLFRDHGLRLESSDDVSAEVANFLTDPDFEAELLEIPSRDALIDAHLRAQDRLGRALQQGRIRYLLWVLRRDRAADPASLDLCNAALLDGFNGSEHPIVRRLGQALPWPNAEILALCADHLVGGVPVLPVTGFIEAALAAAVSAGCSFPIELRDLVVHRPLTCAATQVRFDLHPLENGRLKFIFAAGDTVHATAVVGPGGPPVRRPIERPASLREGADLHGALEGGPVSYGPGFRTVRAWTVDGDQATGHVTVPDAARWNFHPALLAGSTLLAWALCDPADPLRPHMATRVDHLVLHRPAGPAVWSRVRCATTDAGWTTDVDVEGEAGEPVATMTGLHVQRIRREIRSPPRIRLYCLPHSGGTAALFDGWAEALGPAIEVVPVRVPGRRGGQAPIDSMDALIAWLLETTPVGVEPVAFFGHSLGALVAWEWARALGSAADLRALAVSGWPAPQVLPPFPSTVGLDDAARLAELVLREWMPRDVAEEVGLVLGDPTLADVLPSVRADTRLMEAWRYRAGPPLACPLLALGGDADSFASAPGLAAWHAETTGLFSMRRASGRHFYLRTARAVVWDAIRRVLA